MPNPLARLLSPAQAAVLAEFLRFGTVGAIGVVVDAATVYGLRAAIGLYWAGALAYFVAASSNWLINRLWTFRGKGSGPAHLQWATFLLANGVGFVVNRGTYFVLITVSAVAFDYPILAIACGTAVGMFINFYLSRRFVFR